MTTAKLKIHRVSCEKTQESVDGDEVWIRLEGSGNVKYSPSKNSTWQMVAGRRRDVNLEVSFPEQARLEIWDSDSFIQQGDVEKRDNELLAFHNFMIVDDQAQNRRIVLSPGADADGAVYVVWYSLSFT